MFVVNHLSSFYEDSISEATVVKQLVWERRTRCVVAICSDFYQRKCKVDNFIDKEDAKKLVDQLRYAVLGKYPVYFIAKGNNSPNTWFYDIIVDDGTVDISFTQDSKE